MKVPSFRELKAGRPSYGRVTSRVLKFSACMGYTVPPLVVSPCIVVYHHSLELTLIILLNNANGLFTVLILPAHCYDIPGSLQGTWFDKASVYEASVN